MIYPHRITLLKAMPIESSIGGTSFRYDANGVYRAFVQPQRESLSVVNEMGGVDMVVNVYAEPSAPIEATDRMTFDGKTYEFTGSIKQFDRTGTHHIKSVARLLDITE